MGAQSGPIRKQKDRKTERNRTVTSTQSKNPENHGTWDTHTQQHVAGMNDHEAYSTDLSLLSD